MAHLHIPADGLWTTAPRRSNLCLKAVTVGNDDERRRVREPNIMELNIYNCPKLK